MSERALHGPDVAPRSDETDLRDAIGSAIRADWVGSGLSALGVVPYAGDAIAIPGSRWDGPVSAGFSETTLTTLQKGRTDLDEVADSLKQAGHVSGSTAKSFTKDKDGEAWLEGLLGATTKGVDKQVRRNTQSFFGKGRYFDVFVNGVAHESKVGFVKWGKSIENQIKKDAWIVQNPQMADVAGARWHFFASSASNTVGADKRVLDLLDQNNIPCTIHVP